MNSTLSSSYTSGLVVDHAFKAVLFDCDANVHDDLADFGDTDWLNLIIVAIMGAFVVSGFLELLITYVRDSLRAFRLWFWLKVFEVVEILRAGFVRVLLQCFYTLLALLLLPFLLFGSFVMILGACLLNFLSELCFDLVKWVCGLCYSPIYNIIVIIYRIFKIIILFVYIMLLVCYGVVKWFGKLSCFTMYFVSIFACDLYVCFVMVSVKIFADFTVLSAVYCFLKLWSLILQAICCYSRAIYSSIMHDGMAIVIMKFVIIFALELVDSSLVYFVDEILPVLVGFLGLFGTYSRIVFILCVCIKLEIFTSSE